MNRIESMRDELVRLVRAQPFRRFVMNMENGDRVLIEHPENLAFDPETNGADEFYALSRKLRFFSTLAAITGLALVDHRQATA